MRIAKERAAAVLSNEATKLSRQIGLCERQRAKLSAASFGGLSGKSITAAERNVRMQAAIATAHQMFYSSLMQADRANAQLVASLPTTSAGVLDTCVAQDRARAARESMGFLETAKERALAQARASNEALAVAAPFGCAAPVDIGALCASYDALIEAKREVAELNEDILRRAEQYQSDAASCYSGVDTSFIAQALASSNEFVRTGGWGGVSWVGHMELVLSHAARERERAYEQQRQVDAVNRFLAGDVGVEGTAASGSGEASFSPYGIPVAGAAEGSLLGVAGKVAPEGNGNLDPVDDELNLAGGVQGSLEGYAAQGSASLDAGEYVHAEGEAQVWAMSAAASAGATLYEEGVFSPSLNAGYELGLTGLSHEESVRVGSQDFNVHAQSSAELLSLESSAEATFGSQGIGLSFGDEAYVAQGTIGRGITFMGVSMDVSLTGKIGGAGGTAGAKITRDYAMGSIGLGLGAGLGFAVRVDWSGAAAAAQRTWESAQSWWNGIWNSSEEE